MKLIENDSIDTNEFSREKAFAQSIYTDKPKFQKLIQPKTETNKKMRQNMTYKTGYKS